VDPCAPRLASPTGSLGGDVAAEPSATIAATRGEGSAEGSVCFREDDTLKKYL
jgi:hypothetical protein